MDGDTPWPVSLRVGATGLGLGVGCGVGVGVGRPLNLGGIPVVDSMASGVSTGLSSVAGGTGASGALDKVAAVLRSKGLSGGIGCGVGLGYGFGAGLMLRPAALDGAIHRLQELSGDVQRRLGIRQEAPPQEGHSDRLVESTGPSPTNIRSTEGGGAIQLHNGASPSVGSSSSDAQGSQNWALGPQMPQAGSSGAVQEGYRESKLQEENQILRALLRQQEEMADLKQSNRALREAVCKIDPEAAVCAQLSSTEHGTKQKGR